jgi:hypothetical protein
MEVFVPCVLIILVSDKAEEAPGGPEASQKRHSAFHGMSGDPPRLPGGRSDRVQACRSGESVIAAETFMDNTG